MVPTSFQNDTDLNGAVDKEEVIEKEMGQRSRRAGTLGALAWWVISSVLHAILLFLTMLIIIRAAREEKQNTDLVQAEVTPPPEKREEEKEIRLTKSREVNIKAESDKAFYTPEKLEISETSEVETENEIVSDNPARGQQDAVSSIPAEGTGTIGHFGVGGGGRAGGFGWRTGGGRGRRAARFGGTPASEEAVDKGLEWLKQHQEPDGGWDRRKYGGSDIKGLGYHDKDAGITGLSTLAFLGAGHTERHGKYKQTVKKAIKWVIDHQDAGGLMPRSAAKRDGAWMYRNSVVAMTLSEAAGMSRVQATRAAAQKAVEGLANCQAPYEAWNYERFTSKATHVNDTSVTIWAAMALKSAKVAGLGVKGTAFSGVLNWIDHAQDLSDARQGDYDYKGGRVGYRGKMSGPRPRPSHHPSNLLTAGGGVIRVFWGQPLNHPGVVGPCNILLEESLPGKAEKVNYYEWYYATLLMFQKGGEHWDKWNKAMQSTLLTRQRRGDPRELGGSWDPDGMWPIMRGGRVFSTALCVLSLEVYYRYLPMFQE